MLADRQFEPAQHAEADSDRKLNRVGVDQADHCRARARRRPRPRRSESCPRGAGGRSSAVSSSRSAQFAEPGATRGARQARTAASCFPRTRRRPGPPQPGDRIPGPTRFPCCVAFDSPSIRGVPAPPAVRRRSPPISASSAPRPCGRREGRAAADPVDVETAPSGRTRPEPSSHCARRSVPGPGHGRRGR